MEKLNFDELDKIPIPAGLEQRLSSSIDQWERMEHAKRRRLRMKTIGIAASIALLSGIGLYFYNQPSKSAGLRDTYSDPETAYKEAEKAIGLVAENLNRGMDQYKNANDKVYKAQKVLEKQFKIME